MIRRSSRLVSLRGGLDRRYSESLNLIEDPIQTPEMVVEIKLACDRHCACAEFSINIGIFQAVADCAGEPRGGGRVARSKIPIDATHKPVGNSTDLEGGTRHATQARFRADPAKRFGPQTWNDQQICLCIDQIQPLPVYPSCKFKFQRRVLGW